MSDNYLSLDQNDHQSVTRLLIILSASVFVINLLVAMFLEMLPHMPKIAIFLMDSTLLSALTFPIFYLLVFRPLSKNITKHRQAEDEYALSPSLLRAGTRF